MMCEGSDTSCAGSKAVRYRVVQGLTCFVAGLQQEAVPVVLHKVVEWHIVLVLHLQAHSRPQQRKQEIQKTV
jgi:uncharacterized protein YqkB